MQVNTQGAWESPIIDQLIPFNDNAKKCKFMGYLNKWQFDSLVLINFSSKKIANKLVYFSQHRHSIFLTNCLKTMFCYLQKNQAESLHERWFTLFFHIASHFSPEELEELQNNSFFISSIQELFKSEVSLESVMSALYRVFRSMFFKSNIIEIFQLVSTILKLDFMNYYRNNFRFDMEIFMCVNRNELYFSYQCNVLIMVLNIIYIKKLNFSFCNNTQFNCSENGRLKNFIFISYLFSHLSKRLELDKKFTEKVLIPFLNLPLIIDLNDLVPFTMDEMGVTYLIELVENSTALNVNGKLKLALWKCFLELRKENDLFSFSHINYDFLETDKELTFFSKGCICLILAQMKNLHKKAFNDDENNFLIDLCSSLFLKNNKCVTFHRGLSQEGFEIFKSCIDLSYKINFPGHGEAGQFLFMTSCLTNIEGDMDKHYYQCILKPMLEFNIFFTNKAKIYKTYPFNLERLEKLTQVCDENLTLNKTGKLKVLLWKLILAIEKRESLKFKVSKREFFLEEEKTHEIFFLEVLLSLIHTHFLNVEGDFTRLEAYEIEFLSSIVSLLPKEIFFSTLWVDVIKYLAKNTTFSNLSKYLEIASYLKSELFRKKNSESAPEHIIVLNNSFRNCYFLEAALHLDDEVIRKNCIINVVFSNKDSNKWLLYSCYYYSVIELLKKDNYSVDELEKIFTSIFKNLQYIKKKILKFKKIILNQNCKECTFGICALLFALNYFIVKETVPTVQTLKEFKYIYIFLNCNLKVSSKKRSNYISEYHWETLKILDKFKSLLISQVFLSCDKSLYFYWSCLLSKMYNFELNLLHRKAITNLSKLALFNNINNKLMNIDAILLDLKTLIRS